MSRPTDDPVVWSSDTTYPVGADSWNGTPTKVAPSAGVAAAGWEPEDLPPAQHLNYLLNNHGQWIEYLKAQTGVFRASNWDVCTGSPGTGFRCGAYSADLDMWVGFGTSKTCHTSVNNGATWTSRTMPAGWGAGAIGYRAIWDGTQFVVAGQNGGNWIASSPDGVTWTDRSPSGTDGLYGLAWDGSTFVTVGNNGKIYSSTDGHTWTTRTPDSSFAGTFFDVAFAAGLFIAVGSGGTIQTSPDGTTWTSRTPDSSFASDIRSVVYGGSGIWAIITATSGSNIAVQTSPDGITWTSQTAPSVAGTVFNSLYIAGMDVWFTSDASGVWITRDPSSGTWAYIQHDRGGNSFDSVCYALFEGRGGAALCNSTTSRAMFFTTWDALAG